MPLTGPLVALVMFSAHMMGYGRGPINPLSVSLLLLFGVWLLDRLSRPEAPVRSPVFVGLMGLFVAALVLSIAGEVPDPIFGAVLSVAPKVILGMLLVQVLEDPKRMRQAMAWFLISCAFAASAGILQVLVFGWWGLDYSLGPPVFTRMQAADGSIYLRATGFQRWAHQFAEPLAVSGLMAIYWAASAAGRGRRLWLCVVAALSVCGVWYSIARSAWVAIFVGLAVAPFLARPERARRWIAIGSLCGAVLLFSGALGATWSRLLGNGRGTDERALLLNAGLEVLAEHPWNGVGLYAFGDYSPTPERYPVHNAPMQIASELGLPGLFAFTAVIAWVLARLLLARRLAPDARTRAEVEGILIGLIGQLVMMQSDPVGFSVFAWLWFGMVEASAASVLRQTGTRVGREVRIMFEWVSEYWDIVWRRRGVVLFCAAVSVITAYGMSLRMRPVYESVGEFYVSDALPPVGRYTGTELPLLSVLQQLLLPTLGGERDVMFQGLLESAAVRTRVHELVPEKSVGELGADVLIHPTRSHLLNVRARDENPETAARVANAYPGALEGFLASVAEPHEKQGLEAARQAVERAREGLTQSRGELQGFLEEARTPDLTASISESLARKSTLERELEQARISLQSTENRIVAAEDRLRRESNLRVSSSQATQSQAARSLMAEIAKLQEQLAAKSARGEKDAHGALQSVVEQKKRSLAAEMERLVTRTQKRFERRSDSLDESLRRQVVESYVDRAALEAEISAKTQALAALSASAGKYPSQRLREEYLRAEVERFHRMVDASAIAYEEARAQLEGRESQLVIVQQAEPGTRALFPLPGLTAALAALLGLLAGVYVAFAAEYVGRLRHARGLA